MSVALVAGATQSGVSNRVAHTVNPWAAYLGRHPRSPCAARPQGQNGSSCCRTSDVRSDLDGGASGHLFEHVMNEVDTNVVVVTGPPQWLAPYPTAATDL